MEILQWEIKIGTETGVDVAPFTELNPFFVTSVLCFLFSSS